MTHSYSLSCQEYDKKVNTTVVFYKFTEKNKRNTSQWFAVYAHNYSNIIWICNIIRNVYFRLMPISNLLVIMHQYDQTSLFSTLFAVRGTHIIYRNFSFVSFYNVPNFPVCASTTGSINRPGPVPAFLRSPPVIPAPLDMKPFLQFPLESPHPASIGLFHNFNTVSACSLTCTQKCIHVCTHSVWDLSSSRYT